MCDTIYIGNTQHTSNKIMDVHFYDLLLLLKNWQKSDSFAAHFEQHFKYNMSYTYLRKCMSFKLVKQINPIGAMKTFTKPNCNLFMEERPTILKSYMKNASILWTRIRRCTGPTGTKLFPFIFPKHWWSRLTGERVRYFLVMNESKSYFWCPRVLLTLPIWNISVRRSNASAVEPRIGLSQNHPKIMFNLTY